MRKRRVARQEQVQVTGPLAQREVRGLTRQVCRVQGLGGEEFLLLEGQVSQATCRRKAGLAGGDMGPHEALVAGPGLRCGTGTLLISRMAEQASHIFSIHLNGFTFSSFCPFLVFLPCADTDHTCGHMLSILCLSGAPPQHVPWQHPGVLPSLPSGPLAACRPLGVRGRKQGGAWRCLRL